MKPVIKGCHFTLDAIRKKSSLSSGSGKLETVDESNHSDSLGSPKSSMTLESSEASFDKYRMSSATGRSSDCEDNKTIRKASSSSSIEKVNPLFSDGQKVEVEGNGSLIEQQKKSSYVPPAVIDFSSSKEASPSPPPIRKRVSMRIWTKLENSVATTLHTMYGSCVISVVSSVLLVSGASQYFNFSPETEAAHLISILLGCNLISFCNLYVVYACQVKSIEIVSSE
jgi:hypothetical protein